jgi:hypothetical protein
MESKISNTATLVDLASTGTGRERKGHLSNSGQGRRRTIQPPSNKKPDGEAD